MLGNTECIYCYEGGTDNVLKNVSAAFERGKVYAVIGQSGAGKSTLLSLISGLDTCKDATFTIANGTEKRERLAVFLSQFRVIPCLVTKILAMHFTFSSAVSYTM